jgi:hypothetical protein
MREWKQARTLPERDRKFERMNERAKEIKNERTKDKKKKKKKKMLNYSL